MMNAMIKLANFDIAFQCIRYADLRNPGETILHLVIGNDHVEVVLTGAEDLAYRKFREENDPQTPEARMMERAEGAVV